MAWLALPGWLFAQDVPERQRPDSAFLALKKEYAQAVARGDEAASAAALHGLGRVCYQQGHYPQALTQYAQAVAAFRHSGQQAGLAATLLDLGRLYYSTRQLSRARAHYSEALALYRGLRDGVGVAQTYGQIGHLYEKEQRYDSAFFYQRMALGQYQRLNDPAGTAKIFENLGSIFEDLAAYDSARVYFQQALDASRLAGDGAAQVEILNNLGDVFRKTGRYPQALRQTRQALALARRFGDRHQLYATYHDLAKTFDLMGRPDSAFRYLDSSRVAQREIYSEETTRQVALLQTLYDVERKNAEIERLTNARRTSRILTIASGLVVLLVLLAAGLYFNQQRLKTRNERALHEQNRRILEARHELMEATLRNKDLEEANLKQALELKSRELTTHTLHLIQKNQLLADVRQNLAALAKTDRRKELRQLIQGIDHSFHHDQRWEEFRSRFEQVHQTFFDTLKQHSNQLTGNDLRLVALLKMNLTSEEIASLLGVSTDSLRVMRYRLRKKLDLPPGENLSAFIQAL